MTAVQVLLYLWAGTYLSALALSVAATTLGYVGAYVGLWAQKRLMRPWVEASEYKEVPQAALTS